MPGPNRPAPDPAQFATANGVYCLYCGSTPAIDLDFRAHCAVIILMWFRKQPGPYCRPCGLAAFRKMTGDSLIQGWWGPLSFALFNPITVLANLVNRARLAQLPPPIPGAPTLPMDPGTPLFVRPQILGLLVPIVLVGWLVSSGGNSSSSADLDKNRYLDAPATTYPLNIAPVAPSIPVTPTTPAVRDAESAIVGDCVRDKNGDIAKDDHPAVEAVPCSDPRAQATVLAKPLGPTGDAECDSEYPNTDVIITHATGHAGDPEIEDFALCLVLK
ncbi:LppU/SCO3897 family protein [Nocardia aurantiaca]|uniref:Uncharacterized protein n=1 Tax=Nocardia aurantiaca TaxID=2675850 RepID=A0A6I3L5N2_9NOCA|nr:hypothetical protein [Nocardia aurantiaca]MTE15776.1 hypothetical protein [Nocardia aurantiaca]